jgi:hypothetical protein
MFYGLFHRTCKVVLQMSFPDIYTATFHPNLRIDLHYSFFRQGQIRRRSHLSESSALAEPIPSRVMQDDKRSPIQGSQPLPLVILII